MNIYQPFTYLVTFIPTGQRYYGVRTKRGCSPNDLWNTYYTSSKAVHQLIAEHGKDSFTVEIRRVFESKSEAIEWEHHVLTRIDAARNPRYLNKNNGDRKFYGSSTMTGKRHSEDAKRRMSINTSGEKNPNWRGKSVTDETRRKLSEAHIGKCFMKPETRERNRQVWKTEKNPMRQKKYLWWNNGESSTLSDVCPGEGWVRGRVWSTGHREKMLEKRHPKRKGEP